MSTMTFATWFTERHPEIPVPSATAVLKLKAEGGTVPFIARYRKEQTGNIDEVKIQDVLDAHERWEEIGKRQAFIVEEAVEAPKRRRLARYRRPLERQPSLSQRLQLLLRSAGETAA